MEIAIKREAAHDPDREDGRWLWCALLPAFLLVEGARRMVAGLRQEDKASTRRPWFAEAKSQASITTSYVLMARSMLQESERPNRSERLS